MRLSVVEQVAAEIIHFFEPSSDTLVCSTGRRLYVRMAGLRHQFNLPLRGYRRAALPLRLTRRAFRLDKMNAVITVDRRAIVALYQGHIYRCDLARNEVRITGTLRQCRNVLHGGICVTPEGYICFGEYGANPNRDAVPIWMSKDDGNSWDIVFEFPAGSIKHVHGVYLDPYTGKLWIPTGDFVGECFLYEADTLFSQINSHGDGKQAWRAVSLLFERDHLIWGMDSQMETSALQVFDRKTGALSRGRDFPGPVWYSKALNGISILQTTREIGPGVHTESAHLFASDDNRSWIEVDRYRKDHWPMRYFKFGVIAFADGKQSPDRFAMFGEALVGLDGVSLIAALN